MFEVGRLCMKVAGREAGKYCVVVKKMDEKFVMITGPRELTAVKRRRCNVNHLEPMLDMLDIKSDASDSEVLKAYQSANLTRKLGLEPGAKKPLQDKPAAKAAKVSKKPEAKPKEIRKEPAKPKESKKPAPKKSKPAVKKAPAKAKAASKPKSVKKPAAKKAPAKKPAAKAKKK
jgi:large subunit ribosomal protein L14e